MEITIDTLISIAGLFVGGGGGAFFMWRWQRKKAKAEAESAEVEAAKSLQDLYQQMLADSKTERDDRKQQIEELRGERDHYKEERNELRERMEKMARSFMEWRVEADNDRSDMKMQIAKLGRKVEMMAPFMCGDLSCKLRKRVVLSDEGEIREEQRKRRQKETKEIEPLDIKDM